MTDKEISIDTGENKDIQIPSIYDIPGVYRDEVEEFAIYYDLFTKQECNDIIQFYKEHGQKKVAEIDEGKEVKEIRDCFTSIVSEELERSELMFVSNRIWRTIQKANERHFKFELTGIMEAMQFLEYNAPTQHYSAHADRGYNTPVRKLSVSILLSDPADFEGGKLLLPHARGMAIEPVQGSVIFFPAFTIHEVLPITKGTRHALVMWITGPSFK